jgi:methylenetetrahydrofolate reductase (NADPH)
MKVIEHIQQNLDLDKGPQFSFEIVPPARGKSVKEIIDIAETLSQLNPAWIDVTSHASSAYFHERMDGVIEKKTFKKRPGTLGICGIIQNRFKIDTVAHVLCLGFSKEETEDALIELNFLGIQNVLALRGDYPNYQKEFAKNKSLNVYAVDLVEQIKELNSGKFIEETHDAAPLDFCVGVAGYPEKHFEAANMKTDLKYLKDKVDRGADFICTQMFFDNKSFFNFKAGCTEMGIQVPIVPGLKVLKSVSQLKSLPKTFHIDLPDGLVDEVVSSPQHAAEIGKRWAIRQVDELLASGEKNIHFYIMNDAKEVVDIAKHFLK